MPSMTMLMPFSTARHYLLPTRHFWKKALTAQERARGWSEVVLPFETSHPLGEPVCLTLEPDAELLAVEDIEGWLERGFQLRALFFPVGIGLLVLRGGLRRHAGMKWDRISQWEESPAYARYEALAARAHREFVHLMKSVRAEQLELHEPEDFTMPWMYPLFFVPPEDAVPSTFEVLPPEAQQTIPVAIRWWATEVCRETPGERLYLEWMFIIASVVWQGLFNLNALFTRLQRGGPHDPADTGAAQHALSPESRRQLKLYVEQLLLAAEDPMSWIIVENGMHLLETIHSTWRTDQLQKGLASRFSSFLSSLEQQAKESSRTRDCVFIYCSSESKDYEEELRVHLAPLRSSGVLDTWSERDIKPGANERQEIDKALDRAKVVVLFASSTLLASERIMEQELPGLSRGGVCVLWVLARHCNFKQTLLKHYKPALPEDRALADMSRTERDKAMVMLCEKIQAAYSDPSWRPRTRPPPEGA